MGTANRIVSHVPTTPKQPLPPPASHPPRTVAGQVDGHVAHLRTQLDSRRLIRRGFPAARPTSTAEASGTETALLEARYDRIG